MALIGYSSRRPGFSPGGSVLFKTLRRHSYEAFATGGPVFRRRFVTWCLWWSRGGSRLWGTPKRKWKLGGRGISWHYDTLYLIDFLNEL